MSKKVYDETGLEARSIVRAYENRGVGDPEDLLFKNHSEKVQEAARVRDLLKSTVQRI